MDHVHCVHDGKTLSMQTVQSGQHNIVFPSTTRQSLTSTNWRELSMRKRTDRRPLWHACCFVRICDVWIWFQRTFLQRQFTRKENAEYARRLHLGAYLSKDLTCASFFVTQFADLWLAFADHATLITSYQWRTQALDSFREAGIGWDNSRHSYQCLISLSQLAWPVLGMCHWLAPLTPLLSGHLSVAQVR